MSVTVADCLKLPSLREATLVAGVQGLNRSVNAVSVIEYPDTVAITGELMVGNELLISGLIHIKDDVGAQCRLIRHLYNMGGACLILYYVGIFIPEVDERVITTANELGFPLVVMPMGQMALRYSEAISEVTELIFINRRQANYFVPEMTNNIANLPPQYRTMNSVLRLLSDRLHCTLLVADRYMARKATAVWPITNQIDCEQLLDLLKKEHIQSKCQMICALGTQQYMIWEYPIHFKKKHELHLFAIDEQNNQTPEQLSQAAEVVELFLNVWNQDINYEETDALIHAVLSDQPEEMRRVAARMRVDVKSIQTILILYLYTENGQLLDSCQRINYIMPIKHYLADHYKLVIVDTYDKYMVVFSDDSLFDETDVALTHALHEELQRLGICSDCVLCLGMESTQLARSAYIAADEMLPTLRRIYPHKHVFTQSEISFAKACKNILDSGEAALEEKLACLKKMKLLADYEELLQTLCVFLLDAEGNAIKASELLYVHRNTVHYRLGKIRSVLNCDLAQMPAAFEIYQAAALCRLSGIEKK